MIQAYGNTEKITGLYFSGSLSGAGEFIVGKNSGDEKVIVEKITLRDTNGVVQSSLVWR